MAETGEGESKTSVVTEGPQMTPGEQNDVSMGSSMRMGMESQQQSPVEEKPKSLWQKLFGIGNKPQA